MIRRPPRSTLDRSSAASDVYKRQSLRPSATRYFYADAPPTSSTRASRTALHLRGTRERSSEHTGGGTTGTRAPNGCLLYTSDAADERSSVDLGGRRIIKKKNEEIYKKYLLAWKIGLSEIEANKRQHTLRHTTTHRAYHTKSS